MKPRWLASGLVALMALGSPAFAQQFPDNEFADPGPPPTPGPVDRERQRQLAVARLKEVHRQQVAFYEGLADKGDNLAAYQLGILYQQGPAIPPGLAGTIPVARDSARAMFWLKKAADGGHPDALYQLGREYIARGKGADAMTWLRKASEVGHVQAMSTLGNAYFEGKWVPRDLAEAYMWLSLASSRGHREDISDLETQMTADEIAEADARLWTWRQKHPGVAAPTVGGSAGKSQRPREPRFPPKPPS